MALPMLESFPFDSAGTGSGRNDSRAGCRLNGRRKEITHA